ncbi:uncharacterized protein [Parasteatoda tepidariorum]|uniref:uncharacterized protein n=1 Tax=Parasteatoda tepidariorum TaxID=114398 RepID=UPI001C729091|nr:uncharacterized protein LOC122268786 [Parasteatoda tepidariorum]
MSTFGFCAIKLYIQSTQRTKLDNKAKAGVFVGYDYRSRGYRIHHEGKHITIARTVKFLENKFLYSKSNNEQASLKNETHQQESIEETQNGDKNNTIEIEIGNQLEDVDTSSGANTNQFRRSDRTNMGVPPDRLRTNHQIGKIQ